MASTPIPRNGNAPFRSTPTQPAAQKTIPAQSHSAESKTGEAKRLLLPKRFVYLEPSQPETFVNPDPVFDTRSAAGILRIGEDCLKKKRQRGEGPDYIQYGDNGPVRYALSALMAYREAHTVRPVRNRKK